MDWIPATEAYNKVNSKDKSGKSQENVSPYNTVYFRKPIFCNEIKIVLNEPIKKKSFSIHKVNFYSFNNRGIFQSALKDGRQNLCFFINSDKPRNNVPVSVYPCIDIMAMGKGKEIFEIKSNGLIKLASQNLCLGYSDLNNDVVLRECTDDQSAYFINVKSDSSYYFTSKKESVFFVDSKKFPDFIDDKSEVIVSSEMDTTIHSKTNFLSEGNTFWASTAGQNEASVQVLFGKIVCEKCKEKGLYESKKIDNIKIQFVYPAKKFTVFTWNPGQSWRNVAVFNNNSDKIVNIPLKNLTASAILIKMNEGYKVPEFGDQVVYGIGKIDVGFNGYYLKLVEKSIKPNQNKAFEFIQQEYVGTTGHDILKESTDKVSISHEKAISGYKMLKSNMNMIDKIKNQIRDYCTKLIAFKNIIGNQTLKSLGKFKDKELKKIESAKLLSYLIKFSEDRFITSITGTKLDINSNSAKNMKIPLNNIRSFLNNISIMSNNKSVMNVSMRTKSKNDNKNSGNSNSDGANFSFKSLNSISSGKKENAINDLNFKPIQKKPRRGEQENPAEDCLELRLKFPKILSGFYYIQPECANKPLRVFCDFSLYKTAVDFYIFKDDLPIPNPDLSYLGIKNADDVKFQCAKIGLEPLEINSVDVLNRIYDLLIIDGYILTAENYIPIGYDYNCKDNKCSNIYNSLSKFKSKPLNGFFGGKPQKTEKSGRFVGFGILDNKVSTFNSEKSKLSGLICSTNKFSKNKNEDVIIKATCEFNVSKNSSVFNTNSDFIIECPSGCNNNSCEIYGRGVYHGDSSICKAAIHAGNISSSGGKLILNLQKPEKDYIGHNDYGLTSKDKKGNGVKSFITQKYVPKCPIDGFKNLLKKNQNSFIELEMENSNEKPVTSNKFESTNDISIENIDDKLKSFVDNFNKSNENDNLRFKEKLLKESSSNNSMNSNNDGVSNNIAPSLGQSLDNIAGGAMNAVNTGIGLVNNLLNPKSPPDYNKFGKDDRNGPSAPVDPLSGILNNNSAAPSTDVTNQNNGESSISDPNYSLYNNKNLNGQNGPNGIWTPESFMGKKQTYTDPVASLNLPNFDPISLTLKAAQSNDNGNANNMGGGASAPGSGSGSSSGINNFLKNNASNQFDLSNPSVKAKMLENFDNFSEHQGNADKGGDSSSSGNSGSSSGNGSSGSQDNKNNASEIASKPFHTVEAISKANKILTSTTINYFEKIKEKIKIIKQFISKFKTNLSNCVASGVGDCNVINIESKKKFFCLYLV